MAKKQRLNSLDRFRKNPGRLVLEEHSHCEIPAGCGGVVLRWRNPFEKQLVTVSLWAPVDVVFAADGVRIEETMFDLSPGRHVATFVLADVGLSGGVLMFSLRRRTDHVGAIPDPVVTERSAKVLSAGDGTWKASLDEPPEGWQSLDFDDAAWPALTAARPPKVKKEDYNNSWRVETCTKQGAKCLGLPAGLVTKKRSQGTVWVRKVFEVPAPEPGREA